MNKIFTKPFQLLFVCLLALSCVVTSSCKKTEDLQMTCTTSPVKADGVVIHSTLNPVKTGVGIQLTVFRNDTLIDQFNRIHNGNTDFSVSGLMPTTNYKVEMKVINDPSIKANICTTNFTTLVSNTPLVTTASITNINSVGATVTGDITFEGVSPVTERGITWGTAPHPSATYGTSRILAGSGSGIYSATISNLHPASNYYVRAYAYNSSGLSYGADSTFTTLP